MNIKAVIGIVISALSLALTFSPIHAQTAGEILKAYESLKKPERKTRLVEGAKKEGRLVVYGTLGVDAARPMLEKFRQAHPYISIGHYRSLLDSWGEKEGIDYFRRLAKQEVLIRSGYTLQAQLLAAGEVEVVPWSHLQRPLLMADSGAPLGIGFLEPVVSKAQVLLLARRAAHPHAAALFIDWALSEEGQAFVGIDIVRSPVRIGGKQKYMELGRPKTKVITPEFLGQNYIRYTKLYHETFNIQ
jgi:hypothetical protein